MGDELKQEKIEKVESIKSLFDKKGILFDELQNGHLKVDRINFWATSGKWFDPETNTKGNGLNSFFLHLKTHGVMN